MSLQCGISFYVFLHHSDSDGLNSRLTSYEKAQIYEQTISESWLEDVDGDESFLNMEDIQDDLVSIAIRGTLSTVYYSIDDYVGTFYIKSE